MDEWLRKANEEGPTLQYVTLIKKEGDEKGLEYFPCGKLRKKYQNLPIQSADEHDLLGVRDAAIKRLTTRIQELEEEIESLHAHQPTMLDITPQPTLLDISQPQLPAQSLPPPDHELHKECVSLTDFNALVQFTKETLERLRYFAGKVIEREQERAQTMANDYSSIVTTSTSIIDHLVAHSNRVNHVLGPGEFGGFG